MPFQMTHLYIAKNIHQIFPYKIKDISQFYLGNVAPDAVHYRAGYISEHKKASHLALGDERWGMLTNNDEWIENVLKFFHENKNTHNNDFILGYCCHVLSDIYNNITVWTPFRYKYPDEFVKGYKGLYHQESEKVEIELALREENKHGFWVHLKKSKPISIKNIISAKEIEKHKENILYKLYKDKKHQDISSNKLITIESIMNFVEGAADFIFSKIIDFKQ